MKVIGIACSPLARSSSRQAVEAFLKGAAEAGWETELIQLNDLKGCIGCQGCKKDGAGMCVMQDDLTAYFERLPEADAVVMGAGNYMSWPMGQAWTFMNRHYCLTTGGMERSCKIQAGKKLFALFAQGSPDEEQYRKNYEAVCQPFANWGFQVGPPVVLTRAAAQEKLEEIYQMGKAL